MTKLPKRPVAWALLGVAAVGVIAALSFGPLVRARVRSTAEKRGLEVEIGRVQLGWFSVKLTDVHVQPEGVREVRLTASAVDVSLDGLLRPKSIAVVGGHAEAEGTLADLEAAIDAWRARHPATHTERATKENERALRITGDAFSLAWDGGDDGLDGAGISLTRDDDGVRFSIPQLHMKHGRWVVEIGDAVASFSREGAFSDARAKRVDVEHASAADSPEPTQPAQPLQPLQPPQPAQSAPADASTPLIPLPDLHALRARIGLLGKALLARWQPDASAQVEALSFRWGRDARRLTLGPGPFSLARHEDRLVLEFQTSRPAPGSRGGTPLSVRGELPLEHGDIALSLAGGPVGLASLGVQEGAAGLTDVERGTLSGKGSVTLSDDGDALAFDVDLGAKGISISDPRLADDVVRGLALGARARGALNDKGVLRLDDAEGTLGALRLALRGTFEQAADHDAGSFSFAVPQGRCQALFESIPSALLPTLKGAEMKGTFGGKGTLQFDSRKLDDLVLDYDFDNACKLTQVPEELEKKRFSKPFMHRVYLPDGTIGEEETGPGTEAWADLGAISPYMQVAVLTTEDAAFYRHHGFNHRAIRDSLVSNLKARKFVRGASTITMQLAKNLFLSREKTLSRKFEEVVLASYLEQNFSKQEIMELYLNVIEFGPDVYGVRHAADHYFGRKPDEIQLPEAFFFSSLLPRPLVNHKLYERGELTEGWMKNIRSLMETAFKRGTISKGELDQGLTQPVVFHKADLPRPPPRPPVLGSRLFEQSIQK